MDDCPIDEHARAWLEEKLERLPSILGKGILQSRPIVLPTEKFFPFAYDGSDAAVARMFRAVCRLMDVDPDALKVFIDDSKQEFWPVDEDDNPIPLEPGGEFEMGEDGASVSISRSELHDPQLVAATFAHEISHFRLFQAHADLGNTPDRELFTDLTAVHLGFGVFIANDPRVWMADADVWPGTDLMMPRYLPAEMTTYVLAKVAVQNNEERPPWLRHLNQDAAENAKANIRFLKRESL
jgi:hypothetical protein